MKFSQTLSGGAAKHDGVLMQRADGRWALSYHQDGSLKTLEGHVPALQVKGLSRIMEMMRQSDLIDEVIATRHANHKPKKANTPSGLEFFVFVLIVFSVLHLLAWLTASITGLPLLLTGLLINTVVVSLPSKLHMSEDKRRYHGAEHQAIGSYNSTGCNTVEGASQASRFSRNCGGVALATAFLWQAIVGATLAGTSWWVHLPATFLLMACAIHLIPVVFTLGRVPIIRKIITLPGMALQLITTAKPELHHIQAAVNSLALIESEPSKRAPVRKQGRWHLSNETPAG